MSAPLSKIDTYYARLLSPLQRTLSVTLYGASAYSAVRSAATPLSAGTNSGVTPIIPVGLQ
jgi:hypothetical protein